MNPDLSTNQYSQWDVDRYLLSDASLDRDAFEQRMLEDLSLAKQVASSVADLQAISSAASLPLRHSVAVKLHPVSSWSMLAAAAALLIAFTAWQLSNAPNEDQLSQIADNWVAFEGLTTVESLELIATEEPANDASGNEDQADPGTVEQSDWLVEAAREFYLVKNDGAAG